MLLVGNHSGGNLTPDTHVFTLAFSTYFGVERRFHQLAHNLVLSMPGLGHAAQVRHGGGHAAERRARARRGRRAARLPGRRLRGAPADPGSRPRSTSTGARASSGWPSSRGVPIVPVVSVGGQETALFLSRGEGLAQAARARPHVPPQGAADLAGAAVGAQRGRHARPHPAAGEDHDPGAASRSTCRHGRGRGLRARSSTACSAALTALQAERTPAGARMRVEKTSVIDASREEIWELIADPVPLPALHGRRHARGAPRATSAERGHGRALLDATCASARPTSAGWWRSSSSTSPRDLAWTSVTGIDQRLRWRLREADDGRTRVTLRLAYDAPGGVLGAVSEQVSRPMVARKLERSLQNLKARDRRRSGRGERRNEHSGPGGATSWAASRC